VREQGMKRAFFYPQPTPNPTTDANENARNMHFRSTRRSGGTEKADRNDVVLMDGAVFDILLASLELMAL